MWHLKNSSFFGLSKQNTLKQSYISNTFWAVPLCHIFWLKELFPTHVWYTVAQKGYVWIMEFDVLELQIRKLAPFTSDSILFWEQNKRYLECSEKQSCFFTSLDQNQMQLTV